MANKRNSMGGARVADTLRRPLKPVTAPKTQTVPDTSATTRIRRDPTPTWGAGNAQRVLENAQNSASAPQTTPGAGIPAQASTPAQQSAPAQQSTGTSQKVTKTTGFAPDGTPQEYYITTGGVTYKDPQLSERVEPYSIVHTAGGTYRRLPDGTSERLDGAQPTYINPNGQAKTGYIKNGVTYQDANGTQRVPVGSIVRTAGGDYLLDASGRGVRVTPGTGAQENTFSLGGRQYLAYRSPQGQLYADPNFTAMIPNGAQINAQGVNYTQDARLGAIPTMQGVLAQYDRSMQQAQTAAEQMNTARLNQIEENLRAQLKQIENQKKRAQQEYLQANQTSYNAYRDAANPYGINAEQIAALGLSQSGFAETSMVSLLNNYQQALAGNERDRLKSLNELELAAAEAIRDGNSAKYEAIASMYERLSELQTQSAETMAQLGMQAQSIAQDNYWKQIDAARSDRELDIQERNSQRELAQNDRKLDQSDRELDIQENSQLVQQVIELLKMGASAPEIAQMLGISNEKARALVQAILEKYKKKK